MLFIKNSDAKTVIKSFFVEEIYKLYRDNHGLTWMIDCFLLLNNLTNRIELNNI